ncbi:MAG: hypothetical protein G01um101418_823 [Parcubacteria group bacterium Gr01-1014_18]|nr:MAG: hypothetical protein Greene041636_797 [Parcubacteria group bacterium Greene0416_36]TSC80020.1 MAG: hypothetical protein G01um101418_823 [Parcubacteria group bacterium Gr01-1014_18]TSC98112.1 MAG: hypothetical protein Greene101420_883 [Parcubacteria group bacterium Greene1014_20]TSD06628.1 MAG: hypothetical protein Greene07142_767 [Parcubacteria group bacterium Greene0714_2]
MSKLLFFLLILFFCVLLPPGDVSAGEKGRKVDDEIYLVTDKNGSEINTTFLSQSFLQWQKNCHAKREGWSGKKKTAFHTTYQNVGKAWDLWGGYWLAMPTKPYIQDLIKSLKPVKSVFLIVNNEVYEMQRLDEKRNPYAGEMEFFYFYFVPSRDGQSKFEEGDELQSIIFVEGEEVPEDKEDIKESGHWCCLTSDLFRNGGIHNDDTEKSVYCPWDPKDSYTNKKVKDSGTLLNVLTCNYSGGECMKLKRAPTQIKKPTKKKDD